MRGVFSADGSLDSVAERHDWRHVCDRNSFCDALAAQPYDFLFSIDNGWILPPEVLATPQRLAVNFHDAPLPAYAGLHATSWALIGGELSHGITWHEIERGIDSGRILEQRVVPITDDDTDRKSVV